MGLDKLVENYNNLKKLYKEKAEEALKIDSLELFNKYPNLKTIRWTQYTPHFNDGEPCVFGVNEIIFSDLDSSFNINKIWEIKYSNWDEEDEEILEVLKQNKVGQLDLNNDFEKFNNNILETEPMWADIFGDGVEIVITRSGIEIQEYEHD